MRGKSTADPRYLVVFGACAVQFMVIGLLFTYGLLAKEFETEFGWSRTLLSAGLSLAFLMMGVYAVLVGTLSDRYGPGRVLLASGLVYGLGYGLISQVAVPWQLFAIMGCSIGLGLATHDVVTLSTVARWFGRRRGLMTAVVKVGTAAGQMALPVLAAVLIESRGWRETVVILGAAAVVVLAGAALLLKPPPPGYIAPTAAAARPDEGMTFAEIRRSRAFLTLCAVQFLFFPSLVTVPLHIVIHGIDLGLAKTAAAALLSVSAAASVVGRLTVGALSDRITGKHAYTICFLPLIAGLSAMVLIDSPGPLFAAVAVYGFAHGGFFTVVATTVAEYFGTRAHGAAFGAIVFFGTIGGATGPILAGRFFDTSGSYAPAFTALAVFAALGFALVLTLPARQDRLIRHPG